MEELKALVKDYKKTVKKVLGTEFPDDPWEQLWGGIGAVFSSWNGKRAIDYRRIEKIPDEWGTAVNIQAMVFGNMGNDSCTGVAFTRNPGNGENKFYGEYLVNAQGEDVVAGIRTPAPVNEYSKNAQSKQFDTLGKLMPNLYKELFSYQKKLEKHYKDMQDIEFTIEKGKLYMLQCLLGKRNGIAAVRMATEMHSEKMIDAKTAVMRVATNQLVELLLPMIDPKAEQTNMVIAKGLPAGPCGTRGRVVFTSEDAVEWAHKGEKVILVREETSPEDVDGMHKSQSILTTKGGMTSHAALVARGWGKCCIVGCDDIEIHSDTKTFHGKNGVIIKEGDWISLNGTKGLVYEGSLPVVDIDQYIRLQRFKFSDANKFAFFNFDLFKVYNIFFDMVNTSEQLHIHSFGQCIFCFIVIGRHHFFIPGKINRYFRIISFEHTGQVHGKFSAPINHHFLHRI